MSEQSPSRYDVLSDYYKQLAQAAQRLSDALQTKEQVLKTEREARETILRTQKLIDAYYREEAVE